MFMGEIQDATLSNDDYRLITSTKSLNIRPKTSKPQKACLLLVSEGSKSNQRQHKLYLVYDKDADTDESLHDYSTKDKMEDRIDYLDKAHKAAADAKLAKADAPKATVKETAKPRQSETATQISSKVDNSNAPEPANSSGNAGNTAQAGDQDNSTGLVAVREIPEDQLKQRVEAKINAFYKTCRLLCDKTDVETYIAYGMKLFQNDDEKIVSSVNSKTGVHSSTKIRVYFRHLSQLAYKRVDMTASDIKFVSHFKEGPDHKWHATAVVIQDFSGYKDYNILAYKDQTTKAIDIIITTWNEEQDGKTVQKFDIFLGNISVTNTPQT